MSQHSLFYQKRSTFLICLSHNYIIFQQTVLFLHPHLCAHLSCLIKEVLFHCFFLFCRFWHGEYRVAVNINDYLDIYCPYYEGPPSHGRMERYILFMVNHEGYTSCQHRMRGFKRWECNRPSGPDGPLRFSEKFQLFTPFSLGFEFRPGHEYYYICKLSANCLRLRIPLHSQRLHVMHMQESVSVWILSMLLLNMHV